MPTYEYQCGKCGAEFEREQRISDDPIRTCPECGSRKAKRLISATSFVLKGGGWYSDLYSSSKGSDKGSGKGDKKAAPKTGGGKDSGDKGGKSSGGGTKGSSGKGSDAAA